MITVGDLRRAIEGLADDALIYPGTCDADILGVDSEDVDVDFLEVSPFGDGIVLKFRVTEVFDDDFDDEYEAELRAEDDDGDDLWFLDEDDEDLD